MNLKTIDKALSAFPRTELIHAPTPLERLDSLSNQLGIQNLYIKRDDCTGLAFGGNKTRKLEFVLGQAIAEGCDTLITAGGLQSNHARQTAAAAAKLGLSCHLVLLHTSENPSREYEKSGNALLDNLLGAKIHVPKGVRLRTSGNAMRDFSAADYMRELAEELMKGGKKPFVIPIGASTPLGSLGYVNCALEMLSEATALGVTLGTVVVANSSAGTQAGLLAGFRAAGCNAEVYGIAVADADQTYRQQATMKLCNATLDLLGFDVRVTIEDIIVDGRFVGDGYGKVDERLTGAIGDIAAREGILVDPVYSGKALQGLYTISQEMPTEPSEALVFVHTGGQPALFAYSEILSAPQVS